MEGKSLSESIGSSWAKAAFNELQEVPEKEQVDAIQRLISHVEQHRREICEKQSAELERSQVLLRDIQRINSDVEQSMVLAPGIRVAKELGRDTGR
jgi:gamma-glutamyl phosphate reductase